MTTKTIKTMLFSALLIAMFATMGITNNAVAEENDSSLILQNSKQWNDYVPSDIDAYQEVELDAKQTQRNVDQSGKFSFVYKNTPYVLNVFEFDLRSPDSKSFIRDNDGNLIEVEKENIRTYYGYVDEDTSSSVFLLISDDGVVSYIKQGEREITIEPLAFYDKNSNSLEHIVHETKIAVKDSDVTPISFDSIQNMILPEADATNDYLMKIVMDCDYAFYNINTGNWESRLLSLIGGITWDYATETSIGISVEDLACDTSNSVYTSDDHHDLWDALEDAWNGEEPSDRHAVVLILEDDMDDTTIGFVDDAYDPPVSNVDAGSYAIVQVGNDVHSSYGGSSQEEKQELMHELGGHIMGAIHNDADSFTCGSDTCWTIMKPLSEISSYSLRAMEFSTDNKNTIDSNADTYLDDY